MNLKNINKLLIIFIIFPFFSCSKIALMNKNSNTIEIFEAINIEKDDFIIENISSLTRLDDFFHRNIDFKWEDKKELKKIYHVSVNKRSNEIFNFSYILISNDFVYYIDNEAKFIKLNLY